MVKVIFHYGAGPGLTARLAALPELTIAVCSESDDTKLMELLPEADVLWHVLKPASAAMMARAPKLRLIQKIGVGVDTIDLEAAKERGIAVCNLPGTNARAVAELTLALMLASVRRLPLFDAAMRDGSAWTLDPAVQDSLGELGGRTVGLVGYGAVPRLLAPVLKALDCALLYTARGPHADAVGEFRSLQTLLAEVDILSLHVPLTSETWHLIDAAAIRRMRRGAVLINTARGELIDQAALTEALRDGHLAAAGLDVFAEEPPNPAELLLSLPNVVVTPHIGWLTTGSFDRSLALAVENCRRLTAGQSLLHRVV